MKKYTTDKLKEIYSNFAAWSITVDGITFVAMAGSDEMFDADSFYQFGLTDNGDVYKVYFPLPGGHNTWDTVDDLSDVDYYNPTEISLYCTADEIDDMF